VVLRQRRYHLYFGNDHHFISKRGWATRIISAANERGDAK
jgi:hypothetical protein